MKQTHLMEQLAAPENLLSAWREVRGNIPQYRRKRSVGPDGVSMEEFERDLGVQLSALRHALLKETYEPEPPGQFSLRKRNGGERQIAVMTVRDRVAQRAALHVLEPLWEPRFLPCSFGFRPGRSIYDAVSQARSLRQHGNRWVVDGDIAQCFNSLDHSLLIDRVKKRVGDGRVISLIEKWLATGIIQAGPPEKDLGWLETGLKKASLGAREGLDWLASSVARRNDPYMVDRYELPAQWHQGISDDDEEDDLQYEEQRAGLMRQKALQQMATGGFLMGVSWLKPLLARAGTTALAALKTQAGRQLLQKGLLATGGAAGVAAGVAAAAYYISRRSYTANIGILQGSPLSPLLANIYLHSFDLTMVYSNHRMVRFADDWVILCPTQDAAEMAYNDSVRSLARIRLKVNPEKTRILPPGETLDWLGETIR